MAATIGYGMVLKVADPATPTVFTTFSDVIEITVPQVKVSSIDSTNMLSPGAWMENITGLKNLESFAFKLNHAQGGAMDALIQATYGVPKVWRVEFPNGASVVFYGNLTDYALATPIDGRQVSTAQINPTGAPTYNAAAAPVNTLLPSISGLLTQGTVLTANEGTWSNAPTFTYQWRAAAVNIGGATSKTFALTVTQVGAAIDVIVTGTNPVGNASATSGASKNVV